MSAQPSPEDRLSYRGWRTTAGGALGVFLASLVVVSMPVLLKPLTAELGRSREAVAVAFAVAAGVGALCAVPYGMLLDRTEPRRVVVSSLVVFGLAFAALSQLGGDIVPLYLGFAVLGAAGMGSSPVAYGRAVASWFERRRGLALSLVVAGGALGGVVHPPLLQWAIHTCGWRTAVALYGGAVVCLGAPAVRWLVADRRPCVEDGQPRAGAVAAALRSRALWSLAGLLLCATMLQNSVLVHLHALLTDLGVADDRAATALSTMAAAAFVGRLCVGPLLDRLPAARLGAVLMGVAAVGALLLARADSFEMAVLGAVLIGFSTGGEADIVPYLLSRHFGLAALSQLYGLAWLVGAIGGGLGPIRMGSAFDATGSYSATLHQLAGVGLVGTLLFLTLPRPRTNPDR